MMSANFLDFLNPPPSPFIRISRNLSVLFVRKIGQFLNPPSPPPCGRHLSIAPKGRRWDAAGAEGIVYSVIRQFLLTVINANCSTRCRNTISLCWPRKQVFIKRCFLFSGQTETSEYFNLKIFAKSSNHFAIFSYFALRTKVTLRSEQMTQFMRGQVRCSVSAAILSQDEREFPSLKRHLAQKSEVEKIILGV